MQRWNAGPTPDPKPYTYASARIASHNSGGDEAREQAWTADSVTPVTFVKRRVSLDEQIAPILFVPQTKHPISRVRCCPSRAAIWAEEHDMKTAIVTGATSGIGQATVRALVGAGWQVIATGRRADRLKALADELGPCVHAAVFDIRDAEATRGAIDALPEAFRGIDLLVNTAGLALGTAPAQSADLDQWRTMIDTNVTALVTITRTLLPTLVERRGAIVNIASVAGTYPYTGGNVYGGTKAFVQQFTLGLRSDLHGTGVRVSTIDPGMVETEFTVIRTGGNQTASDTLYEGAHPMTADDIAGTILWIATLPPHLNVNRLEIMPVSQSFAGFQVAREGRA
jgi:serine 3-dehydrogenase